MGSEEGSEILHASFKRAEGYEPRSTATGNSALEPPEGMQPVHALTEPGDTHVQLPATEGEVDWWPTGASGAPPDMPSGQEGPASLAAQRSNQEEKNRNEVKQFKIFFLQI